MSMSRIASLGLACLVSGSCTVVVNPAPQQEPEPESEPTPRVVRPEPEPPPRETPVRRTMPALGIPPGHLPDAGYCRVWIEGRPPGQQARSRSCQGILAYAREGSWVLYRPERYQREVRVRHVHDTKPGVIVRVRAYDVGSGRYLRDVALGDDDDNMRVPELRQPTPVRRPPVVITPPPTRRDTAKTRTDTTRTNRGNAGNQGNRGNSGNAGNRGSGGVQADTTRTNRGATRATEGIPATPATRATVETPAIEVAAASRPTPPAPTGATSVTRATVEIPATPATRTVVTRRTRPPLDGVASKAAVARRSGGDRPINRRQAARATTRPSVPVAAFR
jgi:hypothetical protein